jgi:glutaredoxin 3
MFLERDSMNSKTVTPLRLQSEVARAQGKIVRANRNEVIIMASITVYTRSLCGFCTAAIKLLNEQGFDFEEIAADNNPSLRAELAQRSGQSTLPQVFVGDRSVGGYRELAMAIADGEFTKIVSP